MARTGWTKEGPRREKDFLNLKNTNNNGEKKEKEREGASRAK